MRTRDYTDLHKAINKILRGLKREGSELEYFNLLKNFEQQLVEHRRENRDEWITDVVKRLLLPYNLEGVDFDNSYKSKIIIKITKRGWILNDLRNENSSLYRYINFLNNKQNEIFKIEKQSHESIPNENKNENGFRDWKSEQVVLVLTLTAKKTHISNKTEEATIELLEMINERDYF